MLLQSVDPIIKNWAKAQHPVGTALSRCKN